MKWNEIVTLHVQVVENFGEDVYPETTVEESEEVYGVSIKYAGMAYEYVVSFEPLTRHTPDGVFTPRFVVDWDNELRKNTTDWLYSFEAIDVFLGEDNQSQHFTEFIHQHNKNNDDFTVIVVCSVDQDESGDFAIKMTHTLDLDTLTFTPLKEHL